MIHKLTHHPLPQDNIDSEWKDHMLEVNIVQGKGEGKEGMGGGGVRA